MLAGKAQPIVALSTQEAEFIACSNATSRDAIWLRRSPKETEFDAAYALVSPPTGIWADNLGAIKQLETGIVQNKSKYIDVKHRHSHGEQEKGIVAFQYVLSADNVADVFMKPFAWPRHQELVGKLV